MGVARKWHFSTSGGAANLGGVSGDLFEHHGSGIPLLGITSLNRHFYAQIDWANSHCNCYVIATPSSYITEPGSLIAGSLGCWDLSLIFSLEFVFISRM